VDPTIAMAIDRIATTVPSCCKMVHEVQSRRICRRARINARMLRPCALHLAPGKPTLTMMITSRERSHFDAAVNPEASLSS